MEVHQVNGKHIKLSIFNLNSLTILKAPYVELFFWSFLKGMSKFKFEYSYYTNFMLLRNDMKFKKESRNSDGLNGFRNTKMVEQNILF